MGPINDRFSELKNASKLVIRGAEGEHDWTIFIVAGPASAVAADCRIRIRWDAETRRSRDRIKCAQLRLPSSLSLRERFDPRPWYNRTALLIPWQRDEIWKCLETARGTTIVAGILVMPKVALPSSRRFCVIMRRGRRIRRPRRHLAR